MVEHSGVHLVGLVIGWLSSIVAALQPSNAQA